MLTVLGKELRTLRINNGELLKNMADKLNVSSAFLSALEFGEKNVPNGFLDKLFEVYFIPESEQQNFLTAAKLSATQTKINMKNQPDIKRKALLAFAREFEDMDEALAERILRIVNKEE